MAVGVGVRLGVLVLVEVNVLVNVGVNVEVDVGVKVGVDKETPEHMTIGLDWFCGLAGAINTKSVALSIFIPSSGSVQLI